ncbi:CDP-diacylglycerol--glycerol-3-phosphate 3-phosphatidyltransferase [Mammaliicoccus sciuri]|uniref:CDP-diacylglycerol--glycerol-3-phosphate 3-phosphatidyltransferase n=2 Tax=Sporosarcina newyorkensis TaxID=759851 RepID=A0A1T4YDF4_9BACL|nr:MULTISPECIES: CDP-diacylglycerol--glycerol-3-phosphate 3-phosphatidyltransferase [Sporosarcina]EGQ27453.1 CDP-diacylglycerol-glycerol-3-phosphate 3-phosphatidyltransferase [Sporosarcina newyorkensis 2681]MBY0221994.1 CDP-diacylglycerol--glycerol-3-phosphate 3-phosphatidyltransferase [Sporosarcina aquimarina]SKA99852.1 CDP-diacylglycerol--glycerol-3-phosphate 3-phosphatidyltransferase [Sporosarcina newyorkensis]
MNLPNKITLSRVLMIPIFIVFMAVDFGWGIIKIGGVELPIEHLVGAIIFIIASTTDWLDGYLARKNNLVTNMGKFLDPLADKLLVSAAFILLVEMGTAPAWVVIIIISREFAVTGLRLILAGGGEVVAANQLGKIKTVTQILAISFLLLHNIFFEAIGVPFGTIMLYIALLFTIWSGVDYFIKNRKVLVESM